MPSNKNHFQEIENHFRERYVDWIDAGLNNLGKDPVRDAERGKHYSFCQCETEKFIKFAGNKFDVRIYMFMASMFDEILFLNLHEMHNLEYKNSLRFPTISQHHFFEHVSAGWIFYDMREKEFENFSWEESEKTIHIMMKGFKEWFLSVSTSEEYNVFLYYLEGFIENICDEGSSRNNKKFSYMPFKTIMEQYFLDLSESDRLKAKYKYRRRRADEIDKTVNTYI